MSEFESRVIELLEQIAEQTKPAPSMQETAQHYLKSDRERHGKAAITRTLNAIASESYLSSAGR